MQGTSRITTYLATLAIVLAAGHVALAAPGTITALASPASVAPGEMFTVDIGISGYTDTEEIDTWQLRLNWDDSLVSYVSTSFDDGGGGDQWLLKANQSNPTIFSFATDVAGRVNLSYTDIAGSPGTAASSGRLATVTLEANDPGPDSKVTTALTLSAFPTGILFETDLNATRHADPTLVSTSIMIIPEPASLALLAVGVSIPLMRRRP